MILIIQALRIVNEKNDSISKCIGVERAKCDPPIYLYPLINLVF